jgi:LPS sulfotransferase NodH
VPRSGSWLLAEALNNTGLAGQPEEYFRPDHTELWARRWDLPIDGPYDRYIGAALDYSATDNGMFSVKMHWYQFSWFLAQLRVLAGTAPEPREAHLVAEVLPDPRYVYLVRCDKARQ